VSARTLPPLEAAVSQLAEAGLAGRRRVDPGAERQFQATMRNDFLTPRGAPYKWQELTASLTRSVTGGGTATVVPVRYQWQRVAACTGSPTESGQPREWTFARGQSFRSILLHTDLVGAGDPPDGAEPAGAVPATLEVRYPDLPKSPAVDLLLMLSWDVVTFEMMCTHLTTTPALRAVGGSAVLERISGTWAQLQFSDPGAVASFQNAQVSARHLGYGQFDGRASAVFSAQCLDCRLDVQSGPLAQQGRSSYWVTVQLDVETGELLCADMTEMILATLTGPGGPPTPVQKRRMIQLHTGTGTGTGTVAAAIAGPAGPAGPADLAGLAEAVRLANRVAEHVRWQIGSLEALPEGVAELAVMGFRSMVGTDVAGAYRRVRSLQSGLQAMARGGNRDRDGVRTALPEHRQTLEGLLAFGQIAVDEATRLGVRDEPSRKALHDHMVATRGDLTALLALLDRLEGGRSA